VAAHTPRRFDRRCLDPRVVVMASKRSVCYIIAQILRLRAINGSTNALWATRLHGRNGTPRSVICRISRSFALVYTVLNVGDGSRNGRESFMDLRLVLPFRCKAAQSAGLRRSINRLSWSPASLLGSSERTGSELWLSELGRGLTAAAGFPFNPIPDRATKLERSQRRAAEAI